MSCPDCFTGSEHAGTPRGSEATLNGLPTYVSRPPQGSEPKGVVVYVPDLFGWGFVNNRLLCDAYAEKGGFLVYLPDLMGGQSMPFEFVKKIDDIRKPAGWWATLVSKPVWLFQVARVLVPFFLTNRKSVVQARLASFISGIRSSPQTSSLKVGAAGFCWGGRYAILLTHDTPSSSVAVPGKLQPQPLVDCVFAAHPSMLSVPGDVEGVRQPLSVAVGDNDKALSAEGIRSLEAVLMKKGEDHEVVILEGGKHGFAVRTDPKDELQSRYADVAERQAIAWFTRWFSA